MEDGSTKKVFAQDFMLPDVATFGYIGKSSEKSANLNRKEVKLPVVHLGIKKEKDCPFD